MKKTAAATGGKPAHGKEEHVFQAEVARLLHLMVHSVYSEREVFLRELISNAADACDRLRYEAIANPDLLQGDTELKIKISPRKDKRILEISDNGTGMTREELIDNLGTIAHSGTQAFIAKASENQNQVRLIGQFGVGFYSAFIVASRVEVFSRRAGESQAWAWASDGSGSFTIEEAAEGPVRGTWIRLHLKPDAEEFLDANRLEYVVRTYSDHIAHPILLDLGNETSKQINAASAIWSRPKAEISADQYKEFFGSIAGIYSDPALTLHYRAEGRNEYTVLLFVPAERPFDLFDPERRGRQKLYVRRVFITDDAELLPAYLRFVRGIIDSEDMPLNISREMLQDNPTVGQIRKAVTNRVLAELKKTAESDPAGYEKIWSAFGPVLKEGLYEDMERRDQIYELARFQSTKGSNVSLKDYVGRLITNQSAIYYLTAEDTKKAQASPQLEGYTARGIEVLMLTDAVDTFWVRTAIGYDGKPFSSIAQGASDLDSIPLVEKRPQPENDDTAIGTLIAAMKQTLGTAVKDVRRSSRLTDSPVCIVSDTGGLDRTLEKLLSRQSQSGVKISAPILEINPNHPVINALAAVAKSKGISAEIEDASFLLLDEAHMLEGETVSDPAGFARRLSALMTKAFS